MNTINIPAKVYMDYVNNFLTVEKLASHYELTIDETLALLAKGRQEVEENCKAVAKIELLTGYLWDYEKTDTINIDNIYEKIDENHILLAKEEQEEIEKAIHKIADINLFLISKA
jgi:hypothetical protein